MNEERRPENLFLARFEDELTIFLEDSEPRTVAMTGHMVVAGERLENGELAITDIRRVSWVTTPLEQVAGEVTLAGPVYGEEMKGGTEGEYPLEMHLFYGLLRDLPPSCTESDVTFAALERIRGRVAWEVAEPNQENPQVRFQFQLDEIVDARLGAISAVVLKDTVWQFEPLQRPMDLEKVANSLVNCAGSGPPPAAPGPDVAYYRLRLRFVLLSKVTTAAAIEANVQDVIDAACEVWWEKGGIRLDPNPTIATATLPTSGYDGTDPHTGVPIFSVTSITQESDLPGDVTNPSPAPQYVEVYLVDELADDRGGGVARQCASSDAYLILEIPQLAHNHFLLAHELGHVLGLRHPDQVAGGGACNNPALPHGSTCTVMVPDRPNSSRLTGNDLTNIDNYNPALGNAFVPLGSLGPRNADASAGFFQMVRDFPYDDGRSPSQLRAPFTNRTSRSDLWNAELRPFNFDVNHFYEKPGDPTQAGDPFFTDAHYPDHRQPTYSGPNYMYVRVHTCQPLTAPTAQVKTHLFLAYPGVSLDSLIKLVPAGGSDNPIDFSSTQPAMGDARVGYARWDVPATVPAHCCSFAVATSDDDPAPPALQDVIDHPENHNFYSLWDRLATDNDVAQRNLNVQGVPPGAGAAWMAPMPFANIFEEEAAAELEIDARGAFLDTIALTVDGEEVARVAGGQKERIRLHDALAPGEEMQLGLQADWESGQPLGATSPVGLAFYLGGDKVYDYEHLIQVVSPKEAAVQAMDMMVGALRDVAVAWNPVGARRLEADIRRIVRRERGAPAGCVTLLLRRFRPLPADWEEAFRALGSRFGELARHLYALDDGSDELEAVRGRMDKLARTFALPALETDAAITRVQEQALFIQAAASRAARAVQE